MIRFEKGSNVIQFFPHLDEVKELAHSLYVDAKIAIFLLKYRVGDETIER
jgi:hypothetical protein